MRVHNNSYFHYQSKVSQTLFLLAIIMDNDSNPSVEWPGFKWLPQKHTNDTFEMSALYYMVLGFFEPYVSRSQVLSWATGLLKF